MNRWILQTPVKRRTLRDPAYDFLFKMNTNIKEHNHRIKASVLIPIYRDEKNEIQLVVVRRSDGGIHGKQLAFPGGKHDPGDKSFLDTALRETEEEIGIGKNEIEVIAQLPVVDTMTTSFKIYPFLGKIQPPHIWKINKQEVEEILIVNLKEIIKPEAHGKEIKHFPKWEKPVEISYYKIGKYKLWGATYRILYPLIPRLLKSEWDI